MDLKLKYSPGQKILIELSSGECYIGDFELSKKNYIELNNVYNVEENEYLTGTQFYYKSEIKSIKAYQQEENDVDSTCSLSTSLSPSSSSSLIDDQKFNNTDSENEPELQDIPGMTLDELRMIENRIKNTIYIHQTDRSYHDAIKDINQQESIVINAESNSMGRHTNPDIITILTQKHIYIFDIKFLGKIHSELRKIFESKKPIKILHDGRKIVDCLKFRQNVNIQSIFDTLVAHLCTGGEKNLRNLNTCVHKYLNVPNSFFPFSKNINWHERPLDDNRKMITAKKVIFIHKLYGILLHKYLLRNFYKTCDKFVNEYLENLDSIEVIARISSNSKDIINTKM